MHRGRSPLRLALEPKKILVRFSDSVIRTEPLFWLFVVAFNLVGMADLFLNYYHAVRVEWRW